MNAELRSNTLVNTYFPLNTGTRLTTSTGNSGRWCPYENENEDEDEIIIIRRRRRKCSPLPIIPYEPFPHPTIPYFPPTIKPIRWYDEEEPCLIRNFFRQHPDATSAMISCSCKRCSPRM